MESLRVLLVEDDAANRELAQTRLSLLGYQVEACSDGKEALALIEAGEPFDLVVMDLMMPEMSGVEVITWLRSNLTTRHIPILVVAGEPMPGLAAGADHAIAKPYHLHELVMAIAMTMEKRAAAKALGNLVSFDPSQSERRRWS